MDNPTILFEMSDDARLTFFDTLLETEWTSTVSKEKRAVVGRAGEFPPIGFDAVWNKGFTRMFNDGNGGKDIPTYEQIKTGQKRFADFCLGVVSARGMGVTSHESELFRLAFVAFKVKHGATKSKALREKTPAEVQIVLKAFMSQKYARYFDDATESLKRKAVEATESAQRAADLINADDEDDFDLGDFGL